MPTLQETPTVSLIQDGNKSNEYSLHIALDIKDPKNEELLGTISAYLSVTTLSGGRVFFDFKPYKSVLIISAKERLNEVLENNNLVFPIFQLLNK